jgi:hypothetical protein
MLTNELTEFVRSLSARRQFAQGFQRQKPANKRWGLKAYQETFQPTYTDAEGRGLYFMTIPLQRH